MEKPWVIADPLLRFWVESGKLLVIMDEERRRGDPAGRRLWRAKATKLSESYAVAQLLGSMLSDTGVDAGLCERLLAEIKRQELNARQRGEGRIEPRKRYKGQSSRAVQENRPVNCLYIDESGVSNPELLDTPKFFALGAVAIDEEEAGRYCERADAIKQKFFQTTDFTFHEPAMRQHDGPYYFDGDTAKQREFDAAIDQLIDDTDFTVFGVGIRKGDFQWQFVDTGTDPYLPTDAYAVAIVMLMERYVDYMATERTDRIGRITLENQGPKEDADHQMEYARLLISGSQWVAPAAFRSWLETGLRFVPKRGSEPTELADMVSRDLYEWVRSGCMGNPARWERLSRKVYCRGDGQMGKFGVKVFPDHDIRNLIEAHRHQYGAKAN